MRKLAFVGFVSALAGVVGTLLYLDKDTAREREIRRLQDVVTRLESERRVADVVVVRQDRASGRLRTTFRFTEGASTREFTIDGDVAYFDALIVKFEHQYAELGDALRGHTLYLFRRVFGEYQEPSRGFPLDEPTPAPYRLNATPSAFEREIWEKFWHYATNPNDAATKGIRVAMGEAVYTRLQPGKIYHLSIEATGGLNLRSENLPSVLKDFPSR